MNNSIKSVVAAAALFAGLNGDAMAFDVSMTSKGAIGATDLFQIDCSAAETDHLLVNVKDETVDGASSAQQMLNVHIKKGNKKSGYLTDDAIAIAPGAKAELSVAAGKGSYKISVDTQGTDLAVSSPQTYSIEYRCLNASSEFTKPSAAGLKVKTVKKNKTSKLSVACGKSKSAGDTDRLEVKFTNTTVDPEKIALNAQVFRGNVATNVTDYSGDEVFSDDAVVKGASGFYTVLVDNTAFDPARNNARDYTLQYSCKDAQNNETTTDAPVLTKQIPAP